jgi:tetratricopeptide (TPR) repeat protein
VWCGSSVARAQVTPAAQPAGAASAEPPRGAAAEAPEGAKVLYRKGLARYDLGDFDGAIGPWTEAYELWPSPRLLYNLAQAHRRRGGCERAVELYRSYLRVEPAGELRPDAERQLEALRSCEAAAAGPGGKGETTRPRATPAPEQGAVIDEVAVAAPAPRSPGRRWAVYGSLGAALGLGLAAGGLHLWNQARYETWHEEDRRLEMADGPQAQADQARNDALRRSILSVDRTTLVLGGAGLLAAVAVGVVALWPTTEMAAGPGRVALRWTWR